LSDRSLSDVSSPDRSFELLDQLEGRLDFIGVNYFAKFVVSSEGRRYAPFLHQGGLGQALKALHRRYGKPLIVTANGFPNRDDRQRTTCMLESLKTIHDSILVDGVNVNGYFWWPFLHGWEWGGLEYAPFFALVDVDIGRTYARYVTTTAQVYKGTVTERAMDQNLYLSYHSMLPKIEFENWPAVPTA